jgi:hypothetical protein
MDFHPLRGFAAAAKGFATSRAQSTKRSTTGLKVRCFNVTIVTGHDLVGSLTGNAFSKNRLPQVCTTESGSTVM